MEFVQKASSINNEVILGEKKLFVNSKIKARHIIAVENSMGNSVSEVEKGLRLLALLLFEAMGMEAPMFEELSDMEIEALQPLLALIN
jgi:hypothetical protein